jgi:hypothetical protein
MNARLTLSTASFRPATGGERVCQKNKVAEPTVITDFGMPALLNASDSCAADFLIPLNHGSRL